MNTNETLRLTVALEENRGAINERETRTQTTILHYSCQVRNVSGEIPQLLVSFQADVNAQDIKGLTPLHYACTRGNWKICKILLANKNINPCIQASDKLTAFGYAVNYPIHKIVDTEKELYKQVLEELGNIKENILCTDNSNNSTLHLAVRQNNIVAIEYIVKSEIIPINIVNE